MHFGREIQDKDKLDIGMFWIAEVTVNMLKEKLKEFEEKIEDRVQVNKSSNNKYSLLKGFS